MSIVYTLVSNGVSVGDVPVQGGTYKVCVSSTPASGTTIGLEILLPDGSYATVNRLAAASILQITSSTAMTEDCFVPQGVARADISGTITGLYVYLIRIL